MNWINYHHLLYFWVVAREGGLVPAGKVLRLSHPTLSAQIHALEEQLGEKLFIKVGRKLVLTEMGKIVFRYADEIFTLGREMVDTIKGRSTGQPLRLDVGVAQVMPKLIVRELLTPALDLPEGVKLVVNEDSHEKLLSELALHSLDIILSDAPVPPGSSVRAYNHLLGESGVTLFGSKSLVDRYREGFPKSLDGAPFLLPLENLTLRRSLNQWFDRNGIKPRVVAEFEDSALLKVFGAHEHGIFPAPTVVEKEVIQQYQVLPLGRIEEVREHFYAITAERRIKNPAVLAISNNARSRLFATPKGSTGDS